VFFDRLKTLGYEDKNIAIAYAPWAVEDVWVAPCECAAIRKSFDMYTEHAPRLSLLHALRSA
jgi:hypothetical protein